LDQAEVQMGQREALRLVPAWVVLLPYHCCQNSPVLPKTMCILRLEGLGNLPREGAVQGSVPHFCTCMVAMQTCMQACKSICCAIQRSSKSLEESRWIALKGGVCGKRTRVVS